MLWDFIGYAGPLFVLIIWSLLSVDLQKIVLRFKKKLTFTVYLVFIFTKSVSGPHKTGWSHQSLLLIYTVNKQTVHTMDGVNGAKPYEKPLHQLLYLIFE